MQKKTIINYIKSIYYFAKKYKLLFIIAEICILITYAVFVILPINLSKLVDKVIYAGEHELLKEVIVTYIILFAISTVTNMIYAYVWQKLYNNFVVDIKCAVYEKAIKAKAEILSNINSGDLMSRIDWDCDQYITAVQRNLFHFVNSFVLCLGIVIIISQINITIAIFAVAAALLPIIFTKFCGKFNEKYSRENRKVNGEYNGRLYEILKGFREIKINNSENWAYKQIINALNKLINLGNKLRRVDFFVNKGVYLLNLLTSIGIYILSVSLIDKNILTIGGFLQIIAYIALMHRKFNWMLRIYISWKGRKVSIDRVNQVLSYESDYVKGRNLLDIKNIVFSNVVFSYSKNKILNNVNFTINKGEKVAIVGISGIGKSTIINLMLRLYESNDGNIYINNIPIKKLNCSCIRELCSVVSQDIMLFEDTIRDNLLVGREKTDEEINNALEKVGLFNDINSLPNGLDTKITRGFDMSGGQKQRLMIARAILKEKDTYILDEATSALDVESEKLIADNILSCDNNKTMIIISHRYNTISVCEKVIVINEGYIEYAGAIKNAAVKSSKFREMFKEDYNEN